MSEPVERGNEPNSKRGYQGDHEGEEKGTERKEFVPYTLAEQPGKKGFSAQSCPRGGQAAGKENETAEDGGMPRNGYESKQKRVTGKTSVGEKQNVQRRGMFGI